MRKVSKLVLAILAFYLILTLFSCSRSMMFLMGLHSPKQLTEKEISKYAKKYGIPTSDLYLVDKDYQNALISKTDSTNKEIVKNHLQPAQALYYASNQQLSVSYINCYAGDFPNLKWNKNNSFATFLPAQQAPLDSLLSLNEQLGMLKPIASTLPFEVKNYDYIIIVFWDRFLGRQIKRLIRYVQKNAQLAKDQKVRIIYVNNDALFVDLDMKI